MLVDSSCWSRSSQQAETETFENYFNAFKDVPETIQKAIGYQKEVRSDGNEE